MTFFPVVKSLHFRDFNFGISKKNILWFLFNSDPLRF